MVTENGYIKSYRSTIEKPWYSKSAYFHLWHHLLYSATYKEMEVFFNNTTFKLKPGQLITGRKALSRDTGINESKIERILTYFEKTEQQIEQQKTNKNRLITVLNWEKFQSTEQQTEQQVNNNRTTSEQQMNTNKNNKEGKEGKEFKSMPNKSADFIDQIIDCFIQEHGNYEIINKGKERKAAGKILSVYKKKHPESKSEETLQSLRSYFKSCVNIQDNWFRDHMSLSIIIDKFNEINNILKNGKSIKGATVSQIADAVAKNFAVDYEDIGARDEEN